MQDEQRNMERAKRKSEVLIAAQSLDLEVQNVNNLKRLSIGSMDLLIDPEMEYRVGQSAGLEDRKRVSSSSEEEDEEQVEEEEEIEEEEVSSQSVEDDSSFNITAAEYLHGEHTLESIETQPDKIREDTIRHLSGARENPPSTALTQNLLWVPANQHPQVKPEGYLELVQDTLHTIKLEDDRDKPSLHKNKSLVRRPSGLRKSYTEFEDSDNNDDYETSFSYAQSRGSRNSVTLKGITDELAKISMDAGLTNSDAISLARSLSLTGTFSNTSPAGDKSDFASNILMKNGLSVPERSSLRRSKFTTYRKRTPSGQQNESSSFTYPKQENPPRSPNKETHKSPASPKENNDLKKSPAISDYQDIYDHYRQSSGEWEKEHLDNEGSSQEDDSLISTDTTSESVLVKPPDSQSIIHENLDDSVHTVNVKDHNILPRKNNSKKNGWSWLNSIGSSKSSNKSKEDDTFVTSIYSTKSESQKLVAERSNHSKNRHLPIINGQDAYQRSSIDSSKTLDSTRKSSSSSSSLAEEPDASSASAVKATPDKRQRLEKKFVSLFRRKTHSKHSHVDSKQPAKKTQPQVFESHQKVSTREPTIVKEHVKQQQDDWNKPVEEDLLEENEARQSLPALQPAVSVVSAKEEQLVIESVNELEGDDSQEYSGDSSAIDIRNNGEDESTDKIAETTMDSQQHSAAPVVPMASVLPPRKLTFADVKRPEKPNGPMQFTDSAFGFPLPLLTVSTVVMFDHRLPVNVERAIYRLSHLKLSDAKRSLREQVLLSNFMYAYLHLVNHTLYMEQVAQDRNNGQPLTTIAGSTAVPSNDADGSICIPDI